MSKITLEETPLEMCKKMSAYIFNELKGLQGIRKTVETLRPDKIPEKLTLVKAINEAVRDYLAVHIMLRNASISLKSERLSPHEGLDAMEGLWSAVLSELDDVRCNVLEAIKKLMYAEMSHVGKVQGLLAIVFRHHRNYDASLETLLNLTGLSNRWLRNSQLFIETMPQYLDPERFFQTANALYYALTSEFENIVYLGNKRQDIAIILNEVIATFVDLGGIGIESLLVKKTEGQWIDGLLDWGGRAGPTEEIRKMKLTREFKIDKKQLSPYAIERAKYMMSNLPILFYNEYFVLQLYKTVVSNAIRAAKSTYVQMRRTLFHILSLAFPRNQLLTKAQESMLDLKIYFVSCLEVLTVCKQSLEQFKARSMVVERLNSRFFNTEAYDTALGMGEPYLDDCKKAVRKLVNDDYAMSKAVIREAMVEFVAIASAMIAQTGMHPLQLNSTYARFREAVSTYVGIMIKIKNVGTLEESTWLMTGGRGMDEAKAELISRFNKFYESFTGLQGRKRPTTWWFVLQRLPVTESLKEAVRLKSGTLPFSTQPETYKTTLPRPAKPVYLQIEVFDLKKLNIPEQDIVTNEEFQKIL